MIFNVSKLTGHFMIRVFTERYLIRHLKFSLFKNIVLLSGSLQTNHVYSLKQRGNSRFEDPLINAHLVINASRY